MGGHPAKPNDPPGGDSGCDRGIGAAVSALLDQGDQFGGDGQGLVDAVDGVHGVDHEVVDAGALVDSLDGLGDLLGRGARIDVDPQDGIDRGRVPGLASRAKWSMAARWFTSPSMST